MKKIKLSSIKPKEDNPRFIKDDKFIKLCNSIESFAKKMMPLRPIVVDEDNIILGGNMRYRALQHLGYKEVPEDWIKKVSDLTEEEKREFIIKDNVGFGDWDWDMLANEWDMEELEEWGMDLPDIAIVEEGDDSDDDYEEPEKMDVDVVLGDLIEFKCTDGRVHRLKCGSSLETDNWSQLLMEDRIDCVITDPPYNVAYQGKTKDALTIDNDDMSDSDFYQFLYDFYTATNSYVKPGGAWYVWHADSEGANFRKAMVDAGILLKQCLIWVKNSMVMGRQDYHWQHEPCLYGWKEGAAHNWYADRKQTTVLEFDRPTRNTEHPTMKPIPLISYQIANSSKAGDLIADGFLGSGTTMVSAHKMGRSAVGCELDPKYCQVIIDRMHKLNEGIEIFINGEAYQPKEQ